MTMPPDVPRPAPGDNDWVDWADEQEAASDLVRSGGVGGGTGTGRVDYVTQNSDGSWGNRVSSDTSMRIIWQKVVSGSADPTSATAPAVTGMYQYDMVIDAS